MEEVRNGNTKKIQKLLDKRMDLAIDLMHVTCELNSWLEANGADLTDSDITDSTLSGCMIYTEPENAKSSVEDYIRNKM